MIETSRQSTLHWKLLFPATAALGESPELAQWRRQKPLASARDHTSFNVSSLIGTFSHEAGSVDRFASNGNAEAAAAEKFPSIEWSNESPEGFFVFSAQTRKQRGLRRFQRRKRHRNGGLVRSQPLLCLASAATANDEPLQIPEGNGEVALSSQKRFLTTDFSPRVPPAVLRNATINENDPLNHDFSNQKRSSGSVGNLHGTSFLHFFRPGQPQQLSYGDDVSANCTLLPSAQKPKTSTQPTLDQQTAGCSLLYDCPFPACP